MKYILETKVVNTFVRSDQLTRNMTNLPMRWKAVAQSDDLKQLKAICGTNDGIIERRTGEEL